MALLSTVGKTFRKILNDRMGTMLEKDKVSKGPTGFKPNRSCVGHANTLGKIQRNKGAGLTTCCFFLDVRKAYDMALEEWVVEKAVGNWDQKNDVENDEKNDGMC